MFTTKASGNLSLRSISASSFDKADKNFDNCKNAKNKFSTIYENIESKVDDQKSRYSPADRSISAAKKVTMKRHNFS